MGWKREKMTWNVQNNRGAVRNSNLELYRIIVMIFIIAHHYVVNSGVFERMYEMPLSANSVFLFLFGAWGKTGINCFTLITGYFMCKSNITMKKFLMLVSEVLFYNVVLSLIFLFTGLGTIKGLCEGLLVIRNINSNNFTACFLMFYLFIPFLNIFLQNVNQKQHQHLIALLAFLYIFFGTLPTFSITMNYVSWFIVLYVIAAYIRFYPIKKRCWGKWTIFFTFFAIISILACLLLGERIDRAIAYGFVSDSNTFLAFIIGLCSFMFFKDLKIRQSKVINVIGGSTFGVLCIHANSDTMRSWLWGTILDVKGAYSFSFGKLIVYSFLSVLSVFVICTVIEVIRAKYIERPFFKWIETRDWYKKCETKFECLD